jgi:precorrin-2 dehydrogenase / sirohydrochlorin ferrochelatase
MIPVHLDPAMITIALVGRGNLATKRLRGLRALGCEPELYSDAPEPDFATEAGPGLILRLPDATDIARFNVLWVADIEPEAAASLAQAGRAAKVIVNVEDVLPLCDFHTPSVVRRGRLVLSAGTGGASPAAASDIRDRLENSFPEDWGPALEELATMRLAMKAEGVSNGEIRERSLAWLAARFGPPSGPLKAWFRFR